LPPDHAITQVTESGQAYWGDEPQGYGVYDLKEGRLLTESEVIERGISLDQVLSTDEVDDVSLVVKLGEADQAFWVALPSPSEWSEVGGTYGYGWTVVPDNRGWNDPYQPGEDISVNFGVPPPDYFKDSPSYKLNSWPDLENLLETIDSLEVAGRPDDRLEGLELFCPARVISFSSLSAEQILSE
jgi:hypothetical protein